MDVKEKINERLQRMPERAQVEVLNFAEYLLAKSEAQDARDEEQNWSETLLTLAMRGLEDEERPEYTVDDLKERFSS